MTISSESLAKEIAAFLKGRDDIAQAEVVEVLEDGVVSGLITTQGGVLFAFAVEPA